MRSSHTLDRIDVIFDDTHAVANAGILLTGTLAQHLQIEALTNQVVKLGDRPGAYLPGRKLMTLIHSLVVGGDSIDDCNVLRCGSSDKAVGHRVMAPSTMGTFLRSFTFGHVRQLDQVAAIILGRAWSAGAGPGDAAMTMDLDSTICEVHGHQKQGASYGYTRQLGYHPMLATRAQTGEVLHARQRKGSANTARGAVRFLDELVGRVKRAGSTGQLTVRADSGFWSQAFMDRCARHNVLYSLTVRANPAIKHAFAQIAEQDWVDIAYTLEGQAQVAETSYKGNRLIVRRSRLTGAQGQLWPDWRHHGFVTNRPGTAVELDEDHRHHAVVELAIRDLKQGSGLNHCPSGKFSANSAWLVAVTIAHNLMRWLASLGLEINGPIVAQTIRRRFITLPGRMIRSGRRKILRLPEGWPWSEEFDNALLRLRAVQLTT